LEEIMKSEMKGILKRRNKRRIVIKRKKSKETQMNWSIQGNVRL
jgi:hypothetical protein